MLTRHRTWNSWGLSGFPTPSFLPLVLTNRTFMAAQEKDYISQAPLQLGTGDRWPWGWESKSRE